MISTTEVTFDGLFPNVDFQRQDVDIGSDVLISKTRGVVSCRNSCVLKSIFEKLTFVYEQSTIFSVWILGIMTLKLQMTIIYFSSSEEVVTFFENQI